MPIEINRRDLYRWIVTALLTLASLVAIVGGGWALVRGKSPVDRALDDVRRLPLIGMAMDSTPGAESRMRKALEQELASPTRAGMSRPYSLMADLRRQDIVPALRGADDASALAALSARADFVRYLRRADPASCRQLALGNLQRPDLLESEGRQLFGEYVQALEAAYRSGKAAGKPQPFLTRDELTAALRQAGFSKMDFNRLQAFQALSNEVSCDVEIKVDSAADRLPAQVRGPYARYVLSSN
ncbi:MAG: hypothetical protein ACM3II_05830 [Rhodospirillaceae bacterium]